MEFSEYQIRAKETAIYPNVGSNYVFPTLGLVGEAGELANKVKKIQRDHGDVITDDITEFIVNEMGDLMWYMAQLSTEFGISLEDVAAKNLNKLAARKEAGNITGSGDDR